MLRFEIKQLHLLPKTEVVRGLCQADMAVITSLRPLGRLWSALESGIGISQNQHRNVLTISLVGIDE